MLHDGEKFDVGVAEVLDVGNELIGEFAIGEPAIVVLGNAAPGAEMHLVGRNRRVEPILLRAAGEPAGVVPAVGIEIGDDGAGGGTDFGAEAVGVGFERKNVVLRADDFVFVDGAFLEFGNEEFPDSGRAARAHGMDAAVPIIENTDEADAARGRRPDGEVNAGNSGDGAKMRAEFFVSVVVAALAHEMEIEFADEVRKGVGVVKFERIAAMGAALNFVAARLGRRGLIGRPGGFEKAFGAEFDGVCDFRGREGGIFENEAGLRGPGQKRANGPAARDGLRAEERERVGAASGKEGVDLRPELGLALRFGGE